MNGCTRGRARPLAAFLLLSGVLAGCAVNEADLEKWAGVRGGDRRLAGYMADTERPLALRVRAARALFEMGAPGYVVAVVERATPEDRAQVGAATFSWLRRNFEAPIIDDDPTVPQRAKDLLYALLPFAKDYGDELVQPTLTAFATWGAEVVATGKAQPRGRSIEAVALAAGLTDASAVAPPFAEALASAEDPARVLSIARVLAQLRHGPSQLRAASILLERCRRAWPNLPEPLVEAVAVNGNETPLRFLLDAARDPASPVAVRARVIEAAADALGPRAREGLERLLRVEDPLNGNVLRWAVLQRLVDLDPADGVGKTLTQLPDQAGWPDEGTQFRDAIWGLCDESLKAKGPPVMQSLIDTLETSHATARLFAATCLRRLFPEAAAEALEALKKDTTPVSGFSSSGPMTLGDVVLGRHEE